MRSLKEALSVAAAAADEGSDTGEARASRTTRREFVKRAGVAGAGALAIGGGLAPVATAGRGHKKDDVRVVVVGAGLAGLTAAYRLQRHGVRATVIEGNTRIGGRCWTGRGLFDGGQIIEHGGELIDTGHTAIRRFARDLRLDLDDVLRAEPRGTDVLYYFDGQPYSTDDAVADFQAVYPALQADSDAAGYPTTYTSFTPAGQALDNLSVRDWINSRVPGGVASKLGQLLDVAYNIEYGAETTDQSSLNLIYLLSGSLDTELAIFGESDERFKVRGGNDLIVQRLGEELDGQIRTGARLTKIKLNGDDSYTLSVTGVPGGRLEADHVVMAIPFSILRSSVDFSQAGFNAIKTTAIQQQGMGSNSKLQLQFKKRSWYQADCNGEVFSDNGLQTTWEVTRAQGGEKHPRRLHRRSDCLGPRRRRPAGAGGAVPRAARAGAPGRHGQVEWQGDTRRVARQPVVAGRLLVLEVGQYTAFAGAEGERSGNCHFASEHTSIDYQGYLNGAVDTGIGAAKEIIADLR